MSMEVVGSKVTVRRAPNGRYFVVISPQLTLAEMEQIQCQVLASLLGNGKFALACGTGEGKGISYFPLSVPEPWSELEVDIKHCVEEALEELGKEPMKL